MNRLLVAATAAAVLGLCGEALAQYGSPGGGMGGMPMMVPHVQRTETVACPTEVKVVLTPSSSASGWSTNPAPVSLSLDAKNLPRVESDQMICYYAMPDGYNAFTYYQGLAGRSCVVNGDNTGFRCKK